MDEGFQRSPSVGRPRPPCYTWTSRSHHPTPSSPRCGRGAKFPSSGWNHCRLQPARPVLFANSRTLCGQSEFESADAEPASPRFKWLRHQSASILPVPWLLTLFLFLPFLLIPSDEKMQPERRAAATQPASQTPIALTSPKSQQTESASLSVLRYANQGNDLVFTVTHAQSNAVYELQFTTNLGAPTSWQIAQRGFPGHTNFVIPNPRTSQAFFRFRVPHITAPRTLSVPEDLPLSLSGIQVNGFAGVPGRLSLSVINGFLETAITNRVLVSGGNGQATLILSGMQETLNSSLLGLRYQGNTNYSGPDVLTLSLQAGPPGAVEERLLVPITVTPVNDPPEPLDDLFSIAEDTTLFVPAPGVLGNDHDAEGDPLTGALAAGPSHGSVALNPDGSFTYQPEPNFNGADRFFYRPNDGTSDGALATVNIIVFPVNDAPSVRLITPTNGSSLAVGTPINLTAAAFDEDGLIVQIEYLSGSNSLGIATAAPFSFIW